MAASLYLWPSESFGLGLLHNSNLRHSPPALEATNDGTDEPALEKGMLAPSDRTGSRDIRVCINVAFFAAHTWTPSGLIAMKLERLQRFVSQWENKEICQRRITHVCSEADMLTE